MYVKRKVKINVGGGGGVYSRCFQLLKDKSASKIDKIVDSISGWFITSTCSTFW